MLVSVVIPTYNMAAYVGQAIDSVLAQTFHDFEIVVVDDGSTDGTPELLAQYGPRVRVLRQPNRGGAGALNAGIRAGRGEWIAWLSADDLWEPRKLEKEVEAARRFPHAALVYTDYVYVDASGKALSLEHFPLPSTRRRTLLRLFRRCFVNGSTTLIRRDVFDAVGFFDEADRYAPDWDMWFRIAASYDFAHVPEALVRYRIHGAQTSARGDVMERAARRVFAKNVRRVSRPLAVQAVVRGAAFQFRTFPAFVRESVGHHRTIRRQLRDLVEWLVVLVDPETSRIA